MIEILKRKNSRIQFFICSILSGLLLGFGWPTDGNPIYLFIAFVPLLYVEINSNLSLSYIFLFSFIAFSIWNSMATWWLSYARRSDGSFALEAYLIPVFFNSFFMSIIFTFYSYLKRYTRSKNIGYTLLICLWILFEKIHLEWELSWPWLNLGNGFSNRIEWIQWYEYTGTLGGTVWIWIVNIGFTESILKYKKNKNILVLYYSLLFNIGKIFFLILISNLIYMKYEGKDYNKHIEILILQPNIDPYHRKYNISTKNVILNLKNLINNKISKHPVIIIAPETTFPGNGNKISINNINKNHIISFFRNYLKKKSPKTIFITGAELFISYNKNNRSETSIPIIFKNSSKIQWIDIFNSIIQISPSKKIEFHHKSKLVPGVETLPYKKIFFPILGNILLNFGGTTMELGKQKIPNIFIHPYSGVKIAPIICYESVYGEYVSSFFKKNAQLIVIITNDGWWGNSQGHKQHLYYARLRAIENRKFLARSANTGVSCFIDEKGEFLSFLPYGKRGFLYKRIPINNKITFYIKHGDYIFNISLFFTIVIVLYIIIIVRNNKN
ncbi:apolipoprotein N-acyltransferase [Blattabacterium cuenoti]|uniref:apolipoprotein N-acyltransferase n=1 Tax=Blattabacterium cuenoti TaxID=1653831 RepID=UPI00293BE002|nr:apolipoprotein N-acyltransferase [Blattabacterium cuenoti]